MSIDSGTVLRVLAIALFTDGELTENVFNAVIAGAGGPFDVSDVLSDIKDWMDDVYGNLTTYLSDQLDGSQIQVYEFDPVDVDWDEVGTDSWGWDPSQSADPLPRGVAVQINATTVDPDVQGRKYIAGATEFHNVNGNWNSGMQVAAGSWGLDWIAPQTGAATGATITPGVWSPTRGTFYQFGPGVTVKVEPGYQRRRKRGVGV